MIATPPGNWRKDGASAPDPTTNQSPTVHYGDLPQDPQDAAKEARMEADEYTKPEPNPLDSIRAAVTQYHLSLDRREHGDIANSRLVTRIEAILKMPWRQGEATAAADSKEVA